MTDFILHHYPPSPVSQKVRSAFGMKQAHWQSVVQNRLPDRPELFAMTGGFRRIPVLQIGADIYCDTQMILAEIDRRMPDPPLYPPEASGATMGIAQWTDGPLFQLAVRLAFAPVADQAPPELVADRARLYLGPNGDFRKEAADLPHTLAQVRAQLGWLETRFANGPAFMLGDAATHADLSAWYLLWFIRGRYADAQTLLGEFPNLNAWCDRMAALGEGTSTDMSPADALAVTVKTEPVTAEGDDPRDCQGLKPGDTVTVTPATDSGDPAVAGIVRCVSRDAIAILRETETAGRVCVHFPRVGYRVALDR